MDTQSENFLAIIKEDQFKAKKYSKAKLYKETVYLNWTEGEFKDYSRVLADLVIKHTLHQHKLLGNPESLEDAKVAFEDVMEKIPFNF